MVCRTLHYGTAKQGNEITKGNNEKQELKLRYFSDVNGVLLFRPAVSFFSRSDSLVKLHVVSLGLQTRIQITI